MTTGKAAMGAVAGTAANLWAASADQPAAVADLIRYIKGEDLAARAKAWEHAHIAGPAALRPLAALLTNEDIEVTRAARRAMWQIVRDAGRPGADDLRQQAVGELIPLLADGQPRAVRYEAIWMLSEIGAGGRCVPALAPLLKDESVREDARAALERIPGERSLAVLRNALAEAPDDYKPALAASLRVRGVPVPDVPDVKLVPTKTTTVQPVRPE